MRNAKDSGKNKRDTKPLVGKQLIEKKKNVKLVTVELAGSSAKAKGSIKVAASNGSSSAHRNGNGNSTLKLLKNSKVTAAEPKNGKSASAPARNTNSNKQFGAEISRKAVVTRAKVKNPREETAAPPEAPPQTTVPTHLFTPSTKVLKPFREAAKHNKKVLKNKEKARANRGAFIAKPPKKGKSYQIDLRIHSPASEGFCNTAGVNPSAALVRLAAVKGLDMIAVTDYHHAAFIDGVKEIAEKSKVTFIPGVALRCAIAGCSEVRFVALFPETFTGSDIFRVLDELEVPDSKYGQKDYCITRPFREVLQIVEKNSGVLIPSRIDRTPYCQLAIPTLVEEFGMRVFDLVHPDSPDFFREKWPSGGFTFLSFSNANTLGQIGSRSARIKLAAPGFAGLREIMQRRDLDESSSP